MNRRDFIYAASAGAASAAASPVATFAQNNPAAAPDARQSAVKLRTITLEEHCHLAFVAGLEAWSNGCAAAVHAV